MPKARRPPQGVQIRLTVSGRQLGGAFSECFGLESQTDVAEHREGGEPGGGFVRKLPGVTKWSNITLRRPLDASRDLWEWRDAVVNGRADARADGTIELLDYEGKAVATFQLKNAWPVKYSASALNAAGNDVAMETIELSVEGIERT